MNHNHKGKILIIGAGEMGQAMEFLLSPAHAVATWSRSHEKESGVTLEQLAADADTILYCVPAAPLASLAARVAPHLQPDSISLCISKGLDAEGRPAWQCLLPAYGGHCLGVIYGPMISEEIRAGRPAYAQIALTQPGFTSKVVSLFNGTGLQLFPNHDLPGLSWCAILKNVYAMLFGACDALALGDNIRGYLAVTALAEMKSVITRLGGDAGTCEQLAGLGDLITTATSAGSSHHALGGYMVRGEASRLQGEGIHTLAMVKKFNLLNTEEFPLFRLAAEMADDPSNAEDRLRQRLLT